MALIAENLDELVSHFSGRRADGSHLVTSDPNFRETVIYTGSKEKNLRNYEKELDFTLVNTDLIVSSLHAPSFNIIGGRNSSISVSEVTYFHGISKKALEEVDVTTNIYLTGCYDVEIRAKLNGYTNSPEYNFISNKTAVTCTYSDKITISGEYICNYKTAIDLRKCSNVSIKNLHIFSIREDGISALQVDGIIVHNCYLHSFLPNYKSMTLKQLVSNGSKVPANISPYSNQSQSYDHSDFIQLSNCEKIKITHNRLGGHIGWGVRVAPHEHFGKIFNFWNKKSYIWNQSILIKPEAKTVGAFNLSGANSHINSLVSSNKISVSEGDKRRQLLAQVSTNSGSSLVALTVGGSFSSTIEIYRNTIFNHHSHGITLCGYSENSINGYEIEDENTLEHNAIANYSAQDLMETTPTVNISYEYRIEQHPQYGPTVKCD